jgi:NADH:ubiquinone oxidoreductase subunit 3 (subunit A)
MIDDDYDEPNFLLCVLSFFLSLLCVFFVVCLVWSDVVERCGGDGGYAGCRFGRSSQGGDEFRDKIDGRFSFGSEPRERERESSFSLCFYLFLLMYVLVSIYFCFLLLSTLGVKCLKMAWCYVKRMGKKEHESDDGCWIGT